MGMEMTLDVKYPEERKIHVPGFDITGAGSYIFTDTVSLTAIQPLDNLVAKLRNFGFKPANGSIEGVLIKGGDKILYILTLGRQDLAGSYKARVRLSPNAIPLPRPYQDAGEAEDEVKSLELERLVGDLSPFFSIYSP